MGPEGAQAFDVYLRTAVQRRSVGLGRISTTLKMPDYRWGHLPRGAGPGTQDPTSASTRASPRGQDVPGEHRANLRRIIVTQGDTEPGVGRAAAASRPDRTIALRSSQPLPGERRGRPAPVGDGVPAATATFFGPRRAARRPNAPCWRRRSGDTDNPRHPGARSTSARPIGSRLFMFTYFTDRDGKFPAECALRPESGFDPAGTHDEVHADGGSAPHVRRRVGRCRASCQRTCEVIASEQHRRPAGGFARTASSIFPTVQRLPQTSTTSVTIDLFGADQSSNRRRSSTGRGAEGAAFEETKRDDDHLLKDRTYPIVEVLDGRFVEARGRRCKNALNEVLRGRLSSAIRRAESAAGTR